jgi:hypothetical protein
MNCVFPCPAIFGTEVMILWGVPVSPPVLPLGAAMTMVLAPPGVVAVLVPALAIDNMEDGIVLMMVFVVEDWKEILILVKKLKFQIQNQLHFSNSKSEINFISQIPNPKSTLFLF